MEQSRKATVIPNNPIKGLFPRLIGRIYRDKEEFGQPREHFVADPDQLPEWDSVILDYTEVQETKGQK